jgi:predicted dehydrogenase
MAKPLDVLIIGAGNIAGIFDSNMTNRDLPITHAGAYSRDQRFNILASVDPNEERRLEFMSKWAVPFGFSSIEDVINSGKNFDVISICSPTNNHVNDINNALKLKPKLIFSEKPISNSVLDSENVINDCQLNNIHLAVNYNRRWDPVVFKIKYEIKEGLWGKLRSVVGYYNKGILNNGSHMIDLLIFILGPIVLINTGKPVYDFFINDPSIPAFFEAYENVPIHLVCGHAEDYSLFELNFIFSKGILTMENGGLFWRERYSKSSQVFQGYKTLDEDVKRSGGYHSAMLAAIENIYKTIKFGDKLSSNGDSALATQRICESIKKLSLKE